MSSLHHQKPLKEGYPLHNLSIDQLEQLKEFRKNSWALPWFNAFEKYSPERKLIRDFELVSIPKPVLVGRDGIIIASGPDVRGNKLQKTLAQLFAE